MHAYLQTWVIGALVNALRDRQCIPYGSELRVYMPALDEGTYPDASIICGPFRSSPVDPEATINPAALIEVLSPTTEKKDRGIKFRDYAHHGVREYWIIDPVTETVELYHLQDDAYTPTAVTKDGILSSDVVPGFEILVRAIFDEEENLAALRAIMGRA